MSHRRCIALIGATGILGRHTVPRLVERGHDVVAQYRRQDCRTALEACGAEPAHADILDPASLAQMLEGADIAINLASSIPAPGSEASWQMNDRIRLEGTANLIEAARRAGCRRIVQQSVCLVHASKGQGWVTEASPRSPGPVTASAIGMEDMLLAAEGLDVRIARGGTFYGPGTARMPHWQALAARSELVLPDDGSGHVSLVRVEDMAQACVLLAEGDRLAGPWLVADDEPVTWATLFSHLATLAGAPPPATGGSDLLPPVRASNAALKAATAWSPMYPTYRSGLA
jgi:nucleoside-diphosphate-sugar epimerase